VTRDEWDEVKGAFVECCLQANRPPHGLSDPAGSTRPILFHSFDSLVRKSLAKSFDKRLLSIQTELQAHSRRCKTCSSLVLDL